MQVKTCPKCGFENKPTNATCSKCYAALENVPLTEGTQASQPVIAAGGAAARPASASSSPQAPPAQQGQPGANTNVTTTVAPPPPPQYPGQSYPGAPGNPNEQIRITIGPPDRKPYALIIVPLVIVLLVGAALVLRVSMKPPKPKVPPDKVVLNLLAAKKSGKFVRCRPYLSADSIHMIETKFSDKQARSAGFDQKEVEKMFFFAVHPTPTELTYCNATATVVVDEKNKRDDLAYVHVSLDPGESELLIFMTESEWVLVQEGPEWKVDLALSAKRQGQQNFQDLLGGSLPGQK